MNKKLFALPLAVAAMGLASCNKGWSTITVDEAKEIADKIKTESSKEDYMDIGKVTSNDSEITKISGITTESDTKDNVYEFNASNAYMYEYEKLSELNPIFGKLTGERKKRTFYSESKNKKIVACDLSKSYKEESLSKSLLINNIRITFKSRSGWDDFGSLITNPEDTKQKADVIVSKVNKDKNESASYSFNSDNKTTNLQFVCNAKISDYKGTIIETMYPKLTDFKTMDYVQFGIEIKVENYHLTYIKQNLDAKGKNNTDCDLQYTYSQTISTNYNNITPNFDLTNYVEI